MPGVAIPRIGEFGSMNLDQAIAGVESCTTLDELTLSLQLICENYGFSSFNFLETGASHLDVPFFIGTMEKSFSDDYFSNKLIHVDPCVSHARRHNTAFTWSEVPFPEYEGIRKSGAQKTLEVASDYGFSEGLVVPFHFTDLIGRINSSLVVFFWKDSEPDFQMAIRSKKSELHLIMIYWAQRMVEIVGDRFNEGNAVVSRNVSNECEHRLTDREKDVLSWAARGKTAIDTADILTLSEETVKTHIRNALNKLGACNKTHGVAKAIYLGMIDV